jgi:hypothetical protein
MDKDITVGAAEEGYVGIKVGSGVYHFAVNGVPPSINQPAPVIKTK